MNSEEIKPATEKAIGSFTFEGLYTVDENQNKFKYTARRKGTVYLKSLSKSMAYVQITDQEAYKMFDGVKRGTILYLTINNP